MREYGQVQSAFWQSTDGQSLSDSGKLLFLYILTGPHANGIGCYRVPNGYVMEDLSWTLERVSEVSSEVSSKGLLRHFGDVVFIPNFLRWNVISKGNVAAARFKEFEGLPKGEAKSLVARAMLEFCECWTTDQKRVLEDSSKTLQRVSTVEPNPTQPNPDP